MTRNLRDERLSLIEKQFADGCFEVNSRRLNPKNTNKEREK